MKNKNEPASNEEVGNKTFTPNECEQCGSWIGVESHGTYCKKRELELELALTKEIELSTEKSTKIASLSSELKAQKPVDQSLDEAASRLGWNDEDEKRCFAQGHFHGEAKGRAQGWGEAIEFIRSKRIYPTSDEIEHEAKRRGILK